jgi:hypothetical protein
MPSATLVPAINAISGIVKFLSRMNHSFDALVASLTPRRTRCGHERDLIPFSRSAHIVPVKWWQ